MKMYLLFASFCIALLQSCGTSSNVTSNFSIQKRKYNKGWNVKSLLQYIQPLNYVEESEVKQVPNVKVLVAENKKETKTFSETYSTPSSDHETIVDNEIVDESKILNHQNENKLEQTILIQQNQIDKPIENDEDPTESKISPELKRFNTFHIVLLSMFLISILSIVIAILLQWIFYLLPFLVLSIPMYGLSIAQAFRIPSLIPIKEQDKQFNDKKTFALILFAIGTFILAASLCLLVIGILFL